MADGGFTFGGSGFVGNFGGAQDPQGQTPPAQNPQTQYTQGTPQPIQPAQQMPAYGMPQGTYDPNAGYAQQPMPQQMPAQQAPMGYNPAYDPNAAYMQQPMAGQPMPGQQMLGQQMPAGGAPLAGMGDQGGAAQAPFDPNYKFGEKMKDFSTTVKLPEHTIKVDDAYFLNLLAGSISLTRDEKKKIVDSFAKLRQEQVDELVRIFEEERAKFVELSPKHGAQLKKLEDEHAADWKDIEVSYTMAIKKDEEATKAEAIRKQLGLN